VPGALVILDERRRRRHTDQLPVPPVRDRPADLEANAIGRQLYGQAVAIPAPDQLLGPTTRTPADTVGTKLSYKPLEGRTAQVAGVRVNRSATSAGLTYELQLIRAGRTYPLYVLGNVDLEVERVTVLEPGDELRIEVTGAGAAGTELISHFAVAQRGS
jgi:hypothetical protein